MKTIVKQIGTHQTLVRDETSGIARVENGSAGVAHSCHPNISVTGSAGKVWPAHERKVKAFGFIYNSSRIVVSDEFDRLALMACQCGGACGPAGAKLRKDRHDLGWAMEPWHGGGGSGIYAVMSCLISDHAVDLDQVRIAVAEFRNLRRDANYPETVTPEDEAECNALADRLIAMFPKLPPDDQPELAFDKVTEMPAEIGVCATALFRNMMNAAGLDWAVCEKWGEKFNAELERAAWIETDRGVDFTKSFDPRSK